MTSRSALVALCIFVVTLAARAELYRGEPCKRVKGVRDFDATRFSGFWYLVQTDGTVDERTADVCSIVDVVVDDGDILEMKNYLGGGTSLKRDRLDPSKFRSTDPNEPAEITLLATDYRSYAVFYSCPIKFNETISVEVVARSHEPRTLEFQKTINDVLAKNNLGERRLLPVNRKLCDGIQMVGWGKDKFRRPTADRHRAECKKVEGVQNLDLTRFLGSWYAMQSSLQGRKNCGPSIFSLAENGASLRVSSSSQIGGYYKLDKSRPSKFFKHRHFGKRHFLVNYTVLATDYDSYAILYVCSRSFVPSYIVTLARKNELTADFRKKIDYALSKGDLGITYLFVNQPSPCEKE